MHPTARITNCDVLNLFVSFNRYRARFLHLSDIMLTSSHIPEYLVAAFAKRYK